MYMYKKCKANKQTNKQQQKHPTKKNKYKIEDTLIALYQSISIILYLGPKINKFQDKLSHHSLTRLNNPRQSCTSEQTSVSTFYILHNKHTPTVPLDQPVGKIKIERGGKREIERREDREREGKRERREEREREKGS